MCSFVIGRKKKNAGPGFFLFGEYTVVGRTVDSRSNQTRRSRTGVPIFRCRVNKKLVFASDETTNGTQNNSEPVGSFCTYICTHAKARTSCSGEATMGKTSKGTVPLRRLNVRHQLGHFSSGGLVSLPPPGCFPCLIPWFLFHSPYLLSHSFLAC